MRLAFVAFVQFFSCASLVNADHCYADWPCAVCVCKCMLVMEKFSLFYSCKVYRNLIFFFFSFFLLFDILCGCSVWGKKRKKKFSTGGVGWPGGMGERGDWRKRGEDVRFSNREHKISIICINISPLLRGAHNLYYRLQDPFLHIRSFKTPKQGPHILPTLTHCHFRCLSLKTFLDFIVTLGQGHTPFGQDGGEVGSQLPIEISPFRKGGQGRWDEREVGREEGECGRYGRCRKSGTRGCGGGEASVAA